jgi:hypothetical protein
MIAIENRSGKISDRFSYQNRIPVFPVKSIHERFLPGIFLSLAGRRPEKISLYPFAPAYPGPPISGTPPSETASRETWKCPWETEPAAVPVVPLFPQPTGTRGNDSQNKGIPPGIFRVCRRENVRQYIATFGGSKSGPYGI